jgi:hypothetical protein
MRVALALALFATLTLAAGDSKPVARMNLPPPVLAAFLKAYPSAMAPLWGQVRVLDRVLKVTRPFAGLFWK